MTYTFEPGDGAVEMYLTEDEPIQPAWNVHGVAILRREGSGYHVVKNADELLDLE